MSLFGRGILIVVCLADQCGKSRGFILIDITDFGFGDESVCTNCDYVGFCENCAMWRCLPQLSICYAVERDGYIKVIVIKKGF